MQSLYLLESELATQLGLGWKSPSLVTAESHTQRYISRIN